MIEASNQILSFYGWWQLSTCFFAFVALMAIWFHIGRKQNDNGQVWLALSILCWSFSGAAEVLHLKFMQADGSSVIHIEGWRSILSLFNSLFILLALPWFKYLPLRIRPIIKSKYWVVIVGLPFLFSVLPTISKMFSGKSYGLISELDVYYAILTLGFLGVVLWGTFVKRKLVILAWLSLVFVLITFIAQLYKFSSSEIDLILFSAIFKTVLIMIFFALALSWVKELAETIIPPAESIYLTFEKAKSNTGKYFHQVYLKGIPSSLEGPILMTPSMYDLFYKFAEQKIKDSEGWLEIKPKQDQRGKQYDINDYNEIKRILAALLDGLFGKQNWTKDHHEKPLRATLFEMSEKRERKIRFALPPANINLSKNQ